MPYHHPSCPRSRPLRLIVPHPNGFHDLPCPHSSWWALPGTLPSTRVLMSERTCTAMVATPIDHTAATVAIFKAFKAFDPKALDLHNSSVSMFAHRSDSICKSLLPYVISVFETTKFFVDHSFPQTCRVYESIVRLLDNTNMSPFSPFKVITSTSQPCM